MSTICFIIIRRRLIILRRHQTSDVLSSATSNTVNRLSSTNSNAGIVNRTNVLSRLTSIIKRIRLLIQFVIVGLAALFNPSLMNSLYFIFFLSIGFAWSLSIKFGRKFAIIRALFVIYTSIHLLILYLYQFTFFQEALPPLSLWSK